MSLVQQATGAPSGVSSYTTPTLTAATVGNLTVLIAAPAGSNTGAAVTSVVDNAAGGSNTWTRAVFGSRSGSSNTRIEVWWCEVVRSFTTVTVTTGAVQDQGWSFTEWSGIPRPAVDAASPDGSAQTVSSTTMLTPTITSTGDTRLVLAGHHLGGSLAVNDFSPSAATPTTGWTSLTALDALFTSLARAAYAAPSGAGSFAGAWHTSSPKTGGVFTVAFKSNPSNGAGGSTFTGDTTVAAALTVTGQAGLAAVSDVTAAATRFTVTGAGEVATTGASGVAASFTVAADAARATGAAHASTWTFAVTADGDVAKAAQPQDVATALTTTVTGQRGANSDVAVPVGVALTTIAAVATLRVGTTHDAAFGTVVDGGLMSSSTSSTAAVLQVTPTAAVVARAAGQVPVSFQLDAAATTGQAPGVAETIHFTVTGDGVRGVNVPAAAPAVFALTAAASVTNAGGRADLSIAAQLAPPVWGADLTGGAWAAHLTSSDPTQGGAPVANRKIRVDSLEYVTVTLTADHDVTVDTVQFSVDDGTTWHATERTPGGARLLVGPGGDLTLTPGVAELLVRVHDTPEIPVVSAGRLVALA